jgi:hypothetical protein
MCREIVIYLHGHAVPDETYWHLSFYMCFWILFFIHDVYLDLSDLTLFYISCIKEHKHIVAKKRTRTLVL